MTHPTSITCEQFADHLADVLEHDADQPTRAAVERHALACAECGPLLADLRKLRIEAANLPELTPSRDLWAGIEARIAAPVIEMGGRTGRRTRQATWIWSAAAAAVLVIATASVTQVLTRRAYQPAHIAGLTPPSAVAQPTDSSPDVVASATSAVPDTRPSVPASATGHVVAGGGPDGPGRPTAAPRAQVVSAASVQAGAEKTYDTEIARLRAIVRQRRSQLDPTTLAVIERNIQVIDQAIAQCKSALERDPASRFLMQSLNSALDDKVELLRTAAMLPARTS